MWLFYVTMSVIANIARRQKETNPFLAHQQKEHNKETQNSANSVTSA